MKSAEKGYALKNNQFHPAVVGLFGINGIIWNDLWNRALCGIGRLTMFRDKNKILANSCTCKVNKEFKQKPIQLKRFRRYANVF